MSDIPRARAEFRWMRQFISRRILYRFDRAVKLLDRLPQHHRAHGTRAKMTSTLARRIRHWAAMHPTWTQQRIAERFNVTNARVSETLHGKNK
jgi:predicted XRE-type DNA-binding protein